MRRIRCTCGLAVLLTPAYAFPQAAAAPTTALRAARMLDVKTGAIIRNATVVVRGTRIAAAGAYIAVPADATVLDLGDVTLLPGLIDSHTHLLQNYQGKFGSDDPNMVLTVAAMGTVRRALLGVAMGRQDLEAGITTVRDLGNSGLNGDVALRDAIHSGWVVGPRILASTRALAAAGQFGGLAAEAQKLIDQEYVVIAGVNSIEHGYSIPDDALKTMHDKGIFLVPTDYPASFYVDALGGASTPEERQARLAAAQPFVAHSSERMMRAAKMGVRIAYGPDEYDDAPGKTRGQLSLLTLQAYQEAGMPPLEAIRAATLNAADLAGLGDVVGALDVGKFADIIAVDGDPLKDVKDLQRVRFVMKAGQIVRQDRRTAK